MNIGEAARESGVSQRMIRHYEKLEIIPEPLRRASGYREYGEADVQRLRFIADARAIGLPLEEIAELLRLWSEPGLSGRDISVVALACTKVLDDKAGQIERLKSALLDLLAQIEIGSRPAHPPMPQT
ncbi:MerR family transcriptional regulator [Sphingomonas aerophila]|uniref:DNA-binding transcriptional MerR regulator n=1 Tax=Sphingomonas aerophila TaxID=1344948 RepID=A0A7W9BBC1_9SPHN|nr:MerR family transcriptional regulator [Sphingomonas aerophila]MBB5714099.1 DNA-binding transcriptional MerR regulator [Sphingomonas aerophila]